MCPEDSTGGIGATFVFEKTPIQPLDGLAWVLCDPTRRGRPGLVLRCVGKREKDPTRRGRLAWCYVVLEREKKPLPGAGGLAWCYAR